MIRMQQLSDRLPAPLLRRQPFFGRVIVQTDIVVYLAAYGL